MNKASLVEKMQADHDLTKAQAEQMIEDVFGSIVDEVKKGETVSIAGFGIFEAKERAARMGRNPKTGEAIQIKASVNPKFRPAKAFKDALN
ncbi:MAG: HU family DNA-binding protein [Candidatus Kaiserbacteria bacterium]|nr:HU family DNA-binding protein [Candidatus Kaiserbacteria bacterium]